MAHRVDALHTLQPVCVDGAEQYKEMQVFKVALTCEACMRPCVHLFSPRQVPCTRKCDTPTCTARHVLVRDNPMQSN